MASDVTAVLASSKGGDEGITLEALLSVMQPSSDTIEEAVPRFRRMSRDAAVSLIVKEV